MKIVILYSGGLDSLIMGRFAQVNYPDAEVLKVFYDIGQPYYEKEMAALGHYTGIPGLRVERISWLRPGAGPVSKPGSASGDIYIPGRNMVLATAAACKYLPDEVWLGALCGETHEGATDKNFEFLHRLNATLGYTLRPFKSEGVKGRFPLAEAGFNKLDAVEWGLTNGLTVEQVLTTSSCLSGDEGNCGACIVCLRRWGIFRQLRRKLNLPGLYEKYNTHPMEVPANREIVYQMATSAEHYDYHRASEILPAVGMWLAEKRGTSDHILLDFTRGFCLGREGAVTQQAEALLNLYSHW